MLRSHRFSSNLLQYSSTNSTKDPRFLHPRTCYVRREDRKGLLLAKYRLSAYLILTVILSITFMLLICASPHPTWACYHTALDTFLNEGIEFGVIGRVVGASFAVLVAEELFASGCELLISITSAGQIISLENPPYVVLIEKALRDEGTSYHYLPPSPFSYLHQELRKAISFAWDNTYVPLHIGASWTTDAPFRETEEMIAMCRNERYSYCGNGGGSSLCTG